ncbi:D-alanyl-D-alanine carboxypeptidase [Tissierella sp. MSJ-40]|uniref:D-alanyl-D-alanine carboxypeptidase n=1 Tax=Tissierella simiarum TaxID=2841534 RepID=A0ABS6E5S8_9FIRM|nr:D-alanyl-D-alanine carboxypeptidase family protein [Tissierella simiarum]MBU5437573.1 D-alanyl-D-alanine carboxypeptidase [Tissierella simiarum]
MKRKIASIILVVFILSSVAMAFAEGDLNINAKSAVLMDYNTGEIIYEKNLNERLAPASVTKIMTLLLGMEALETGKIKLNDDVSVSDHASGMGGSQVFLEAGEIQKVEEIFKAICLRSANDASVALAEHIAGSEEIFVKMMNDKAKALGMKDTNFMNCSGLPSENHYTSAYDIALMSKELLKYNKIHDWLTIYMYDLKVGKTKSSIQTMVNTNRLIKEYEGANGIKTGSTNEAGFCLSGSAKRGNLQLIAVIMGSETSKIRFDESKRLLDYGFANYDSITVGRKGDILGKVSVEKGKSAFIEAMLEKDSYILLPKGDKGKIDKEIVLPEHVNAPINAGDEVGLLIVRLEGKEVDKIKLVAKSNVEKANLANILKKTLKGLLMGR